jgi:hypothetical protein
LSKVVELWNHRPDGGSIYYAFKPPWVRRPHHDAYFILHPERRTFAAQRAADDDRERLEMEEGEAQARAVAEANQTKPSDELLELEKELRRHAEEGDVSK